eukprot:3467212-Ditylum_brightwellii.AAC.2
MEESNKACTQWFRIQKDPSVQAICNKDAYHLMKQYNTEKNGRAAWKLLLEWYNRDVLKVETLCPGPTTRPLPLGPTY